MKTFWGIFKSNKKKEKEEFLKRSQSFYETRSAEIKRFEIQYIDPITPASDEEFIERIGEFSGIQFLSRNDYSGGIVMRELISHRDPEIKSKVLSFLAEHPIGNLLQGDLFDAGCDMNSWEIRFVFDDATLNRKICGYGHTGAASPYIRGLVGLLPHLMTDSERHTVYECQKTLFMRELERYSTENKNNTEI